MPTFFLLPVQGKGCLITRGIYLLLMCMLSAAVFATPQTAVYTELDWKGLVPEGWHPPIIQPDPSAHAADIVDTASLVSELRHKQVKIPGYMVPIVFDKNRVSDFVLVPFLEHQAKTPMEGCRHIHHEPNQMVYISLAQPAVIENPFTPVWVTGEMLLQTVETEAGFSGYRINNANTMEYVY